MSSASSATVYAQSNGVVSLGNLGIVPIVSDRDPATTDVRGPNGPYKIGQVWVNKVDDDSFVLSSFTSSLGEVSAVWTSQSAAAGSVSELDGDSGTATPSGGAINILGTAAQIETAGAGDTITLSIADPFNYTGDLDITGTLTVSGLSTLGALTQVGTCSINETGAATTTIGSAAAGAISVDTTAGVTINADTASSFTTTDAAADLSLTSTLGRVIVTAGEDAADAIYLHANAGTSEVIRLHSDQGTGVASIHLESDVGGVTLTSGLASADAVNIACASGGIDIDGALEINIASSQAAATAISLDASDGAGGITMAAGTGGLLLGNQADCTTIDVGDIAPTASRTVTIGGGTVVTASVTDLIDIGPDGATTNADSVKQVDINTGVVATGQSLTNIATGDITSGTHTVLIQSGDVTAGTVTMGLATGTGTKTVGIGNGDAATTLNISAITNINASVNANTGINTGTSTGTITIGNGSAGAVAVDTGAGISLGAATASDFTCSLAASAAAITISASAADGGITMDAGATPGVTFTNGTQSHQMLVGSGSPNGSVTAAQGSMYIDVAGSTSTTILFVNTDGSTAWVGVGA